MKVKVGGLWVDVDPKVKSGGVWTDINESWVKEGGVWKKSYSRYPTVSGGTLTADSTYYYMDFTTSTATENTTTGTLVVEDQPITVDYLLVGGGGPGISWDRITGQRYYGSFYNFRNVRTLYGGGAGAVVSGSTTLNPGTYSVSVGNGAPGGTGVNTSISGVSSYALNGSIVAHGGASPLFTGSRGSGSGAEFASTGPDPGFSGGVGGNTAFPGGTAGIDCNFYIYYNNWCYELTHCVEDDLGGGGAGGAPTTGKFGLTSDSQCTNSPPNEVSQPGGPPITLLGLTVGKGGGADTLATPNTGNGGAKAAQGYSGASGVFRIRFAKSAVGG